MSYNNNFTALETNFRNSISNIRTVEQKISTKLLASVMINRNRVHYGRNKVKLFYTYTTFTDVVLIENRTEE